MVEDTVPELPEQIEVGSSPGQAETAFVKHSEALSIAKEEARQFVEAVIDDGMSPKEAARLTGRSLTKLMRDNKVRAQVEKLLDSYGAEPQVRRDVVRAKLLEVALTGTEKGVVAALKMLGQDPEVGIFTTGGAGKNQVTAVQVNIGDNTRKVLDKLKGNQDDPGNVIESMPDNEAGDL